MPTLSNLQEQLATSEAERAQLISCGWYLQYCWLVQVKPGGTARTDRQYWQVRSRQPIFDGKKLKHLRTDEEVEDYKAAIDRGRQLKQIDRQIKKLQQQLDQIATAQAASATIATAHLPESIDNLAIASNRKFNPASDPGLAEQEKMVQAVIATSQQLRNSLRQALRRSEALEARNSEIRNSPTFKRLKEKR